MLNNNKNNDTAMELIEKIANHYNERIHVTVDKDYNICVHINNIDRIYRKKYLSNLEGRGETYKKACENYIRNLMDKKYYLRYNSKFYATKTIRNIIRKSNYKEG